MTHYSLNHTGRPDNEVNWVEELETWSQRSQVSIGWVPTQNGDQWEVEVKCKCIPSP